MEGLQKYLIVFIHFLRLARRDGEREREREGGRDGGTKEARRGGEPGGPRERGMKGYREEERAEGERGREGKGRLFGIRHPRSHRLSLYYDKCSRAETVSKIAEVKISRGERDFRRRGLSLRADKTSSLLAVL